MHALMRLDDLVQFSFIAIEEPSRARSIFAEAYELGLELVQRVCGFDVNVIIKLHDRSCDLRQRYCSGVDWMKKIAPWLEPGRVALADSPDVCPYASASESVRDGRKAVAAVEQVLADRSGHSSTRRAVAADLFHEPGTATARCVDALYEAVGLEPIHQPSPQPATAGLLERSFRALER